MIIFTVYMQQNSIAGTERSTQLTRLPPHHPISKRGGVWLTRLSCMLCRDEKKSRCEFLPTLCTTVITTFYKSCLHLESLKLYGIIIIAFHSLAQPDPTLCYMMRRVWSTHCTSVYQERQVSGKLVIKFITVVMIFIQLAYLVSIYI